jgi:hypothetical protein
MMARVSDIRIEDEVANGIPRAYVVLGVSQLLRRLAVRPLAVHVHFSDENGPKGGADIRCRMLVSLPAEAPITVEQLATTARLAFDRVYKRVRRQLEHPRRPWRESQQHPKKYFAAKRLWA